MKELIAKDDMGVFADGGETVRADSRDVARMFGRKHKNVLRAIDDIVGPDSGFTPEFVKAHFAATSYVDSQGRRQRAYAMTRDGFCLLALGFTGRKAAPVQEAYLARFDTVSHRLDALLDARCQLPLLEDAIKAAHHDAYSYHYSNECDMINRLVLGVTASEFRKAHPEVPEAAKSIRPYLSAEQFMLLDELQHADIAYLAIWPDNYPARVEALLTYMAKRGYQARWTGPKRCGKATSETEGTDGKGG